MNNKKMKVPRKMKKSLQKAFARIGISGQYDAIVQLESKKKKIPRLIRREYDRYKHGIEEIRLNCWLVFNKSAFETLGEEQYEESLKKKDPGEWGYLEEMKMRKR